MRMEQGCLGITSLNEGESGSSAGCPQELFAAYQPLARKIARRIYDALPEDGMHEFDDLLQSGLVGLLSAARAYKPERGVAFPVYARYRIRGEILDQLRRLDLAPRGLRQRQRRMAEARLRLGLALGREPSADETAEMLGMDIEESRELALDLQNVFRLTDDFREIDPGEARADEASRHDAGRPDNIWERAQLRNLLGVAIESLAPREREIISLYYLEGKSMKAIGGLLGIHTSRVFQLRNRALEGIGERLKQKGIQTAVEMAPDNLAAA